jgi:tetratricopeptide (TPR) repeat protein
MFEFFKRLFSKREEIDPDAVREDLWIADFGKNRDRAFPEADERSYRSFYEGESFGLELTKRNVFAWIEKADCRYRDFAVEGEFSFPRVPGPCACGFVFRMADDADFMSALVSRDGHFRLDVVFNGSQRPLIAWTETPAPVGDRCSLRVIALANAFTVMIDGRWAGEATDDTFVEGQLGIAAQNYGEAERVAFYLDTLFVESRPADVAAWHTRFTQYELPSPIARTRLAETFLAMGEYLKAAVQLRKLERHGPLAPDALFLKAESAIRLGLYDEALDALRSCVAAEPGHERVRMEIANVLYLQGKFIELKETLESMGTAPGAPPAMLNLLGHARHNLGDYSGAARAYQAAYEAEPAQALLALNAARSFDAAGDEDGAIEAYTAAAKGFFRSEDFADMDECVGRLEELGASGEEMDLLLAKVAFRDGRWDDAEEILRDAVGAGCGDSSAHYLMGLIEARRGRRSDAIGRYREAVGLDPEFPLYRFRLAEALWLEGLRDGEFERELEAARAMAPEDGWIANLAGMASAAAGDVEGAAALYAEAIARLPGESAPSINLSELRSAAGDHASALEALRGATDAPSENQRGNVHARAGELDAAASSYRRAIAQDPGNVEYLCNLAACYLETEDWSNAEEQVRKALERSPDGRAYRLAGEIALVYGDWVRAETAFRAGLEGNPDDADLLAALARCYIERRDRDKADATVARLSQVDPERGADLGLKARDAFLERLSCAGCGREWWAPRALPAQSSESIRAMPPDDAPAGACPACGKIFCIGCRKDALSADSRLTCPDCAVPLKLSDDTLRYLVRQSLGMARRA